MGHIPYWRLSALYFFYFALVGVISPYWSVYLNSLGFSGAEIGLIIALPMITRLVAPNVWGYVADKTGHYLRVVQIGAALASGTFVGLFYVDSFWPVVIFTSTFTFFWNAILPQFEVLTLDFLKGKTQSYSLIRLWGSVGFVVAVVSLGAAFEFFSSQIVLAAIWGLLLCIFVCSLSLHQPDHSSATRDSQGRFLDDLVKPATLLFFTATFFLHLSHGGFYGFYSLYLLGHEYSSTSVGLLWAVGVIAEIILFLKIPQILSNFNLWWCFLFSVFLAVFRWLLVAFWVESVAAMVVAQLTHAFTFGLAHATSMEFLRRQFSLSSRGKAQAFYSASCFGAGGALGAYSSGLLWSFEWCWSFLASAGFALIGLCLAFWGALKYSDEREG